MESWETDSAIDEYNECDETDQSIGKFDSKRNYSNIKLTESSSSGICVENDSSKHSHESKLSELEQQVEDAEARCGTLQQQLEFMRLIYKNKLVENNPVDRDSDNENSLNITDINTFSAQSNFSHARNTSKLDLQYNASVTEKSSPPLSEVSGLFYAADQNFMEDLNSDYLQESSVPNNPNLQNGNEMYAFENNGNLHQSLACESNYDLGKNSETETCEFESVLGNEVGSEHQGIFESKSDLKSGNISESEKNYEVECASEYGTIVLHRNHTELETIFENENLRLDNESELESNPEFDMKCEIENNFPLESCCDNVNYENYFNPENHCELSENLGIERTKETLCIPKDSLNCNIHIESNFEKEENGLVSDKMFAYADHPTHDKCITEEHGFDTSSEILNKGENDNPVQAIKGILNGLNDSVNIITQLNTSETHKKKHRPLSRMNTKSDISITTLTSLPSTVTVKSGQSKYLNSVSHSCTSINKTCQLPQASHELYEQSEQQMLNYESANIHYEPGNVEYEPENVEYEPGNIDYESANICYEPAEVEYVPVNIDYESANICYEPANVEYEPANIHFEPANVEYEPANIHFEPANVEYKSSNVHYEPANHEYKPTNINYEPLDAMDKHLKDIEIRESELQMHPRHHHRRHHEGSRRHHRHDEGKLDISVSEDVYHHRHLAKHNKDVFDTFSLKPKHSYHKDLGELHCQSHHSLNTLALSNNSGRESRKFHKKKDISRRKYRKLEKRNWNDFESENLNLHRYEKGRKFKNTDYDSLSVTTHKNKKHKKYSKSLILNEDLNDMCTKENLKSFKLKLKNVNENSKLEAKETEELKGISSEKYRTVIKSEKNKTLSTFLPNNSIPPPTVLHTIGKNESYCKVLAPHYEETPNFAVPTVSSRLKQNDKPILQFFNFRNIPFVVGTSTSRSHNLALNLQQALSIIKLRNPSGPVLGDLTTEVNSSILTNSSRPSTAGSVAGHKVFCPVAMAQMRNPKLQMADNNECLTSEDRSEIAQSAETEPLPGTFESLLKSQAEDENVGRVGFPQLKQKENVWDVDQADENQSNLNSKLRCTCFPNRPCINYQKLLYEYLHQEKETYLQVLLKSQRDKQNSNQNRARSTSTEIPNAREQLLEFGEENEGNPVYGQIQAHSKGLREVLLNMHRDFLRLSHKYEFLQSEVENQHVEGFEAAKELEKLEDELGAKENDIMVVMSLYKELTTLKQQVKALKAKTNSQHTITKSASANSHEPTVSIRLTRLLRTIQKFQDKLLQD